jgi:hydrogenase/urease accessory protein HupE
VAATLAPDDAALFDVRGRCAAGRLDRVALPWLEAVGTEHRAIVRVVEGDKPVGEALLTLEQPSASLDVLLERTSSVTFLPIGIEHILIGADHLLFLFGLVLVRARRRDILAIVTAFTLAHSVTLSAAVLGWMSLSSTLVEAVIALSVAFVGVENLLGPDMKKRWRLTFLFGLVHGFGFAGVLAEIGLPEDATFAALFFFNVGVEIGQLLVLALVLPLLALARRWSGYDKRALPVMSGLIIVVGLFWFLERVGLL